MKIINKLKNFFTKKLLKKAFTPLLLVLSLSVLITLVCITKKTITVVVDGQEKKIITFKSTVGEALEKEHIHIDPKDKIDKALNSKVADKDIIKIKRAVNIKIIVDGKDLAIKSAEETIDFMLKVEKIVLNPEDKITPEKNNKLAEDMKIEIIRVESKILTESVPIDYETIVKNDSNLPNTQRVVTQEGKNGEKKISNTVLYENGKEVSKKQVSETIVTKPTNKIITQGTGATIVASRGGPPLLYSKVFNAKATAYYAVHGVGKTYTASGRKAVRDSNGYSTIAVDPAVIPYGTKLFVEGYGLAVAADSGTGITGTTIDVFFDTYKEACNWAVKHVNVYILK